MSTKETIQQQLLEEAVRNQSRTPPGDAYTTPELGEIMGRSSAWVRRTVTGLILRGEWERVIVSRISVLSNVAHKVSAFRPILKATTKRSKKKKAVRRRKPGRKRVK